MADCITVPDSSTRGIFSCKATKVCISIKDFRINLGSIRFTAGNGSTVTSHQASEINSTVAFYIDSVRATDRVAADSAVCNPSAILTGQSSHVYFLIGTYICLTFCIFSCILQIRIDSVFLIIRYQKNILQCLAIVSNKSNCRG